VNVWDIETLVGALCEFSEPRRDRDHYCEVGDYTNTAVSAVIGP